MTVAVVGCGNSAQYWGETKFNLSIGVNDAGKWGYPLDQLVVINFPRKFTKQRTEIIMNTQAKMFTHTTAWKKLIPNANVIKLSPFNDRVRDGMIYHSKTSPFVAISLALLAGATDIVLFGVDMVDHPVCRKGTKTGDFEIALYVKLFNAIKKTGRNVWLGANGSCFDNYLQVYEREGVAI